MKKNKLFILPGWGEQTDDQGPVKSHYRELIKAVSKKYDVIPIEFYAGNEHYSLGSKKSLDDILTGVAEKLLFGTATGHTILGFSIGALLSYFMAFRFSFKKTLICSMSPFLSSDVDLYSKKELSSFTLNQIKGLRGAEYSDLILKTRMSFFWGEKEQELLKRRSAYLGGLPSGRGFEIKGAGHKIEGDYLKAVVKELLK